MTRLYVLDTTSLISHFSQVFSRPSVISSRAHALIEVAFRSGPQSVQLSIPSVVFVEIFDKFLRNAEFAAKFYYEVLMPIQASPNIEIKPIEREVLDNMLAIGGELANHEVHDKLILASAMMLQCPLITSDEKVIKFVEKYKVIPAIVF
jgi:predicted nucleic acid-binding protein